MKVMIDTNSVLPAVRDLGVGACFKAKGNYYMDTDIGGKTEWECVNIQRGTSVNVMLEQKVEELKGVLGYED